MHRTVSILSLIFGLLLAACGSPASVDSQFGVGVDTQLPPPERSWLPTVHIAPAKGWPADGKPVAAPGLSVHRFAAELLHPRWIHVLPNGDVLVAETDAPPKPKDQQGLRARVEGLVMRRAGSGTPSANRITLLRDRDGDGVAELRSVFLTGLNSPLGMALVGDHFYVANTDAVVAYPYFPEQTAINAPGYRLAELPAGARNHHWTKSLIANAAGTKLYVGVGSNSNVAENGLDEERYRAAILEVDIATRQLRIFASGLRNPVGLAWEPQTQKLWTAVNERDELGNDLVPDYMTSVRDGGFYGWPYSYFGPHIDERVKPPRPDLVETALIPDYALGAHTASLGLAYGGVTDFPTRFQHGMFVGQHGSWNRKPRSGYKVVFVRFEEGRPVDKPLDVLTGFVSPDGNAWGRPVGVQIDGRGALLVADDVGGIIWRVTGIRSPTN